jgi:spermidine/putrescine-binding protein
MGAPTGWSRRELIRAAAAAGVAVVGSRVLTACGDPDDGRIKVFNWQDYIDERLLADFEAATGLAVSYSTYASNDELGDRLALAGVPRRGNRTPTSFDLIVPSDSLFVRLRDQDRVLALDADVVTEALRAGLAPAFRTLASDPGNRFAVPWATGTTGIAYDRTAFAEPPTWDVFLDTTRAGTMSLLDEKREAFAAALFGLGIDPNTTDQAEIDAATERLGRIAEVAEFDSETYLDRLVRGELVVAQAFSSDLAQARAANADLAFVIPDAGGTRWIDLMCIPADAPNPDGANRFIAFMLDPRVSAQNAMAIRARTGNTAAEAFLPAEFLDDPVISPSPEVEARLVFLDDLGDVEERYNDAWESVRG